MRQLRRILWPIVQALVTVALIAWIVRRNNPGAVAHHLQVMNPWWMALAIGVMFASILLGTWQWACLLSAQGIHLTRLRLLRAYCLGMFLNFVLPSGVGGDVVRAVQIHKHAQAGTRGVAATLLDRFAGLFTLALFASVASWLLVAKQSDPLFSKLAWGSGFVSLAFCVASLVLFSRRVVGWISPMARILGEGKLLDKARDLRSSFLLYRDEPGVVVRVVALSVATQFLRLIVHWCAARALGLPLDFAWILLFIPVVSLIAIVPVSVGGWGLREGAQKTFFSYPGVMPGLATDAAISGSLALALVTSFLGMLTPALAGLVLGIVLSWRNTNVKSQEVET
ncbi:MAG: flippase-like domain-containing protein [Fibrobacterota bacterium]|nr:flippase-like domain-containing protein [Fibrobacterota bacterium]QQS04025.1 MAG: flippase-like domain-containing protein [Fibrobacterota bacterium]